jgi:hypothetical protein
MKKPHKREKKKRGKQMANLGRKSAQTEKILNDLQTARFRSEEKNRAVFWVALSVVALAFFDQPFDNGKMAIIGRFSDDEGGKRKGKQGDRMRQIKSKKKPKGKEEEREENTDTIERRSPFFGWVVHSSGETPAATMALTMASRPHLTAEK